MARLGAFGKAAQRLSALFVLCWLMIAPPLSPSPQPSDDCQSRYEGIVHCQEDDGDVHVIVVDLQDPHVFIEMVMADDVTRPNTIVRHREKVDDMAQRARERGAVIAINGDYFGHVRGPEGLSVRNGVRLDRTRLWDLNPAAVERSSLAISRFNQISIGRKSAQELSDPDVYRNRFYNAVGGAPLILNNGVPIPGTIACRMENIPPGTCRRTIQTVVGVNQSGDELIIAVGHGRDVDGMSDLLVDYGAYTGLKLDAGGSSQLWYDGRMLHDTDRPVANGLLVFYSPTVRHDAVLVSRPRFPVLAPGERAQVYLELENTGFLAWDPNLGYRFRNVRGWPLIGPAVQPLPSPAPIKPGEAALLPLTVVAPTRPGVYDLTWQLLYHWQPIGPPLDLSLVVAPPGPDGVALQAQIARRIEENWESDRFQRDWPGLRQEIEVLIQDQLEQHLRNSLCHPQGPWQHPPADIIWRDWLLRPVGC